MKDLNRTCILLAGLRIAPPLHEKKKTPGEAPGVEGVWLLMKERPFRDVLRTSVKDVMKTIHLQGSNLHTLGVDIFAEELFAQLPPGTSDSSPVTFPRARLRAEE